MPTVDRPKPKVVRAHKGDLVPIADDLDDDRTIEVIPSDYASLDPAERAALSVEEEREENEGDGADGTLPELYMPDGGLYSADDDDDDESDILDMSSGTLVRANAITLADERGEWHKDKGSAGLGDGYRSFVREATRYERLSEEEERVFGLQVRDHKDRAAAKKLVVHNLRLAIKMAHQYRRVWTNLMDLVQEASQGLAIAAERWDPDQGTRFGSYAIYWIRAQLTRFLMTNGRMIHTGNTRAGRKLYFQLPKVRRRLLAAGQEPTIAAIAKEVGEDEEEVAKVVARLEGREASLSTPIGDDDGATLADVLNGDDAGPEQNAFQLEMAQMIHKLTKSYASTIDEDRDRAIWVEHLTAHDPVSLVDLGKRYGVSKQRMGQLATRLKRGFRRYVIETLGPETELHWLFQQD